MNKSSKLFFSPVEGMKEIRFGNVRHVIWNNSEVDKQTESTKFKIIQLKILRFFGQNRQNEKKDLKKIGNLEMGFLNRKKFQKLYNEFTDEKFEYLSI